MKDCPEELLSDEYIKFDEIQVISAKNETNIETVKQSIRDTLDKYAEARLEEEANSNDDMKTRRT